MLKPTHRDLQAKTYLSTAYQYNLEDFPYFRDIYDRDVCDKWTYNDTVDLIGQDGFIDCCDDSVLNILLNQAFYMRYNDRRIGYETIAEFYIKLKGRALELRRRYDVMFKSAGMIEFPLLTTDLTTETVGEDVVYTKSISVSHGSGQASGKNSGRAVQNTNRSNKDIDYTRTSQKHDSLTTQAQDSQYLENRDGGTARAIGSVNDTATKGENSNHSAGYHDATGRTDGQTQAQDINTSDNLGFDTDTPQDKQYNILPSFQSNIRGGNSSMNKGVITSYNRGSTVGNDASNTASANTNESQDETVSVDARIDYNIVNGEQRTNEASFNKGSMLGERTNNSNQGLSSATSDDRERQALTTVKGATDTVNNATNVSNSINYSDSKTDTGKFADNGNISTTKGFAGNQANLIRAYREVIGRNVEQEYLDEFEDLFLQIDV